MNHISYSCIFGDPPLCKTNRSFPDTSIPTVDRQAGFLLFWFPFTTLFYSLIYCKFSYDIIGVADNSEINTHKIVLLPSYALSSRLKMAVRKAHRAPYYPFLKSHFLALRCISRQFTYPIYNVYVELWSPIQRIRVAPCSYFSRVDSWSWAHVPRVGFSMLHVCYSTEKTKTFIAEWLTLMQFVESETISKPVTLNKRIMWLLILISRAYRVRRLYDFRFRRSSKSD